MRSRTFILYCACAVALTTAVKVSQEDAERFAASRHPMFVREAPEWLKEGSSEHENDRMLQQNDGCTQRTVVVYESEYDVDYKDGDFQIGVTPIYFPSDITKPTGNWWWDWAVFRGTNGAKEYGTMMIQYNPRESLTFGFSESQSYWPITGGYLDMTACPGGYSYFIRQEGDVRYYMLNICKGC